MTVTTTEQWRTIELSLTATVAHPEPFALRVEATFEGADGTTVRRPAFWDGADSWKVRFAPPAVGAWRMTTDAGGVTDPGLHGVTAFVDVREYTGHLDLYRHGFLRVAESGHHLVHADGTPFFYLGDTHWALPHERWATSNAPGVPSQFRYVVDKRAAQGFTVYQSEPIWHPHPQGVAHDGVDEEPIADLRRGVTEAALDGLRNLDAKFAYIADAGLVHATAMIDWVGRPADFPHDYTPALMERLATYWCARYGSYPVIWTIGQEIDADFYGVYPGDAMTPWTAAIERLRDADGYQHPIFPHQENTGVTTVSGSRFAHEPWHDGFATQPQWDEVWDVTVLSEYWASGKPALAYESPYELFWTDGRHALSALYKSYLSGMRGYGYGVSGVWNDVYSLDDGPLDAGTEFELVSEDTAHAEPVADGLQHFFSPETRRVWWFDGANSPTGDQLGIGARYLRSLEWWTLTPRFGDHAWSDFGSDGRSFLATAGNDLYVALFTDGTPATGTVRRLDPDAEYAGFWMNPRSGQQHQIDALSPDAWGECILPPKPTADDWVVQLQRSNAATQDPSGA